MKNNLLIILLMAALILISLSTRAQMTSDTLLVALGDARVTVADIDAMANQLPDEVRAGVFDDPARIGEMLRSMVVRRAIVEKLFSGELNAEPDIESLRARQVEAVLVRMQLEKEMAALTRPDLLRLAKEEYEKQPDGFWINETVDVRHVLIGVEDRSAEKALSLAMQVYQDLLDGELAFEQAVEQYSDDPSHRNNKGLFEQVQRGQMAPTFEEAAFALENPGQMSRPVRSRFGYHIIRLEQRHPARKLSFAQARPQIETRLLKQELGDREARVRQHLGPDANTILLQRAHDSNFSDTAEFQARLRLATEEAALRWYRTWYAENALKGDFNQLALEYYLTNREEFKTPPTVRVAEVFVPVGDAGEDAARLSAEHLRKLGSDLAGAQLLLATPPPGAQVAERRYVSGEHESTAAKMGLSLQQPGQSSSVVRVSDGYLFVTLLGREPVVVQSFEQISDALIGRLRAQKELALWNAHVAEFHQLPAEANPEAIAALRTRYIDT